MMDDVLAIAGFVNVFAVITACLRRAAVCHIVCSTSQLLIWIDCYLREMTVLKILGYAQAGFQLHCRILLLPKSYLKVPVRQEHTLPNGRSAWRLAPPRRAFMKATKKPNLNAGFKIARKVIPVGTIIGIGFLRYCGLGLVINFETIEPLRLSTKRVREKLCNTYFYIILCSYVTTMSALGTLRSKQMLKLMENNHLRMSLWAAMLVSIVAAERLEYHQNGFGPKQWAWILHSTVMGTHICLVWCYGAKVLIGSALCTAGVIGALSAAALYCPRDKIWEMNIPIVIGLFFLGAALRVTAFGLPQILDILSILTIASSNFLLFSVYTFSNIQKIIKGAEVDPHLDNVVYDSKNEVPHIYVSAINIFLSILCFHNSWIVLRRFLRR